MIRSALPRTRVVRVDGRLVFWYGTRTLTALRELRTALAPAGAPA